MCLILDLVYGKCMVYNRCIIVLILLIIIKIDVWYIMAWYMMYSIAGSRGT